VVINFSKLIAVIALISFSKANIFTHSTSALLYHALFFSLRLVPWRYCETFLLGIYVKKIYG